MPDVTTRDIATRDITTRNIATRDINASTASTILYQWNGTGTTATVGDDPTFPTVGDSGNNNRMEFDGSNWAYVNEDEPRFFDDKGYMAEGAATELTGYSADLTNAAVTGNSYAAKNAVGLTGASNEAFTLTDSNPSDASWVGKFVSKASGTDTYYAVFRVGYVASPATYPALTLTILSGGTRIDQSIVFNRETGAYVTRQFSGSVVSITRRQGTFDHWEVVQSITDNNTGNTMALPNVTIAYNADGSSAQNNATTGTCVVGSIELYKNNYSFSPILTEGGTTKTRLADTGVTLPPTFPATEGSFQATVSKLFLDALASSQGLVTNDSSDAANFLYFPTTANALALTDGTNTDTATSVWSSVGESVVIKARWSGSDMQFFIDGVGQGPTTFDGDFNNSGSVTLFKSLTRGAAIKSLTIWSEDKGNSWGTE